MWFDISFRGNGSDDRDLDLRLTYFCCHSVSNTLNFGAVFEYRFEVLEGGDEGVGDISIEEWNQSIKEMIPETLELSKF